MVDHLQRIKIAGKCVHGRKQRKMQILSRNCVSSPTASGKCEWGKRRNQIVDLLMRVYKVYVCNETTAGKVYKRWAIEYLIKRKHFLHTISTNKNHYGN